jgi:lysine-ketoglutarate reductase/saccharopine dehydrogenase-like protein (TIGR00300 family)
VSSWPNTNGPENEEAGLNEIVEAEGHLIDSQLLNAMCDTVGRHDASFEVLEFRIGRTNDEPSFVSMRVTSPDQPGLTGVLEELVALGCRVAGGEDAHVTRADRDGCAPDDFYSTTNHQTSVRLGGEWVAVEHQRMDAVIVIDGRSASCRKLREIRAGDHIVCGIHGVKIVPEFQERDRLGFAFMSNEISSERRVEVGVTRIAAMMRAARQAGERIAFVAGPVVVHTGGGAYFCDLIRHGYVNVLLAGNALAVHDVEVALFGTALGVNIESGMPIEHGHEHHMRAINRVRAAGGLKQMVESGQLKSGVMKSAIDHGVEIVLAGSVRDDGPLPDVITEMVEAQRQMRAALPGVRLALMLSTMLHSIATGNMLPAGVRTVCVDINPAVVTKLADRGSWQSIGLVTDVESFLRELAQVIETGAHG